MAHSLTRRAVVQLTGLVVSTLVGLAALTVTAAAKTPAELFSAYSKGSTATVDHSAWDALLKAYVVPGEDGINRVAYARFKAEGRDKLKAYIKTLEGADIKGLDRPEQFAFWANLYNAKTIDIVLDKYPVKSIKDISLGGGLVAAVTGGPWKAKVLEVERRGTEPRRHRTRHFAPRVQGPARALCRQLRVVRLPEPRHGGLHRRQARSPARRRRARLRQSSARHCDQRRSGNGVLDLRLVPGRFRRRAKPVYWRISSAMLGRH